MERYTYLIRVLIYILVIYEMSECNKVLIILDLSPTFHIVIGDLMTLDLLEK